MRVRDTEVSKGTLLQKLSEEPSKYIGVEPFVALPTSVRSRDLLEIFSRSLISTSEGMEEGKVLHSSSLFVSQGPSLAVTALQKLDIEMYFLTHGRFHHATF